VWTWSRSVFAPFGSRTGPGGEYARPGVSRSEEVDRQGPKQRPLAGRWWELTTGLRVLVRRNTGADVTGEIVEDYAAVTDPGGRGHEWAPVHRGAITVDDGRLIFAATADLTIDPGSVRSVPDPAVRTPGRHRGE
jgi:hypothetical protein